MKITIMIEKTMEHEEWFGKDVPIEEIKELGSDYAIELVMEDFPDFIEGATWTVKFDGEEVSDGA